MTKTSSRRGFLRGLTALPLVGGGLTLIGNPTRAAVPVTSDLLDSYDAWLHFERRWLQYERQVHETAADWHPSDDYPFLGLDGRRFDYTPMANGGARFRHNEPSPSTRAAVVLSAVGCDWTGRSE